MSYKLLGARITEISSLLAQPCRALLITGLYCHVMNIFNFEKADSMLLRTPPGSRAGNKTTLWNRSNKYWYMLRMHT